VEVPRSFMRYPVERFSLLVFRRSAWVCGEYEVVYPLLILFCFMFGCCCADSLLKHWMVAFFSVGVYGHG